MADFPWFFATELQAGGQGHIIDNAPAADKRHIELFNIMPAKPDIAMAAYDFCYYIHKVEQQLALIIARYRFQLYLPLPRPVGIYTAKADAYDFSRFGIYAAPVFIHGRGSV